MKKLIPALALLLVSAVLLATSSFAWFSMNTTVTVTGMEVKTKVSSNLQIYQDILASNTRADDEDFTTAVDESTTYATPALLEPVSTRDGKAFFYTTNALSNGDAVADTYKAYNDAEVPTSEELNTFREDYSAANAVGYVDYVFQLKAVNTVSDAAKPIKITKLDLIYSGATDNNKAYRVAVFVQDITSAAPSAGSGPLVGIYAPNGASNQSANAAVGAVSGAPAAISTTSYNSLAGNGIATVPASATKYFKVVLRLYLEGEDTTCKNDTFAALTGNWTLDVELKLDDTTTNTAIDCIGKYTSAVVETTTWFYDGTYVWNNVANIGTETGRTAIGSADAAVKTAFGYVAP